MFQQIAWPGFHCSGELLRETAFNGGGRLIPSNKRCRINERFDVPQPTFGRRVHFLKQAL